MRREAENVISYYSAVRFKERCVRFAYFDIAFTLFGLLLVKLGGSNIEFWYSFTLTFCLFTILSVVVCIIQDFRMKRLLKSIFKISGTYVNNDLLKNMQEIKFIHEEVIWYLTKMEMYAFEKTENSRYRTMWKKYFLDWFMAENDMVYKFRQNSKNEFDEYVIRKHINELGILHQKMLCLFGNDDEFSQIIGDHFKSLRQDFYNLIVLKR